MKIFLKTFAILISFSILFSACGTGTSPPEENPSPHIHEFSSDWTYNDTHHWHYATCEHTSEISGKALHEWDSGSETVAPSECSEGIMTYTCVVCGNTKTETIPAYTPPHIHEFSSDWTYNDTHHWHYATCEHTSEVSGKALHEWDSGSETVAPSECSEGVMTYTCVVCGNTKTETIPMLTPPLDSTTTNSITLVFITGDLSMENNGSAFTIIDSDVENLTFHWSFNGMELTENGATCDISQYIIGLDAGYYDLVVTTEKDGMMLFSSYKISIEADL